LLAAKGYEYKIIVVYPTTRDIGLIYHPGLWETSVNQMVIIIPSAEIDNLIGGFSLGELLVSISYPPTQHRNYLFC
jgi:hypothetical protein